MTSEWEKRVKYALTHHNEVEARRLKKEKKEFYSKLRKYVSIPILIGVVAGGLLWNLYGGKELIEVLLSWTIGLTLVATIIAYFPNKIRNN